MYSIHQGVFAANLPSNMNLALGRLQTETEREREREVTKKDAIHRELRGQRHWNGWSSVFHMEILREERVDEKWWKGRGGCRIADGHKTVKGCDKLNTFMKARWAKRARTVLRVPNYHRCVRLFELLPASFTGQRDATGNITRPNGTHVLD